MLAHQIDDILVVPVIQRTLGNLFISLYDRARFS